MHLTGQQIGEFVLGELLAEGGYADVYVAFQSKLQRTVALKLLRGHDTEERRYRLRFEREARLATVVEHRLAPRVYDYGRFQVCRWSAREYIRGESLESWLRSRGAISFDEFFPFFAALAGVVHYLHQL